VQLFHRHNRALELTDAARACLPKLREGFESLAQAIDRLRAHQSGGMLTVSAAPSGRHFIFALGDYVERVVGCTFSGQGHKALRSRRTRSSRETESYKCWNCSVRRGRLQRANGVKVVEYEFGSADWKAHVQASKFGKIPAYGTLRSGYIALQDHESVVVYRNLKIKKL